MEENIKLKEAYDTVNRSLVKLHEINALLKEGKFIIAYEKLGGVIKILNILKIKIDNDQFNT
jgi:hypothetical protein